MRFNHQDGVKVSPLETSFNKENLLELTVNLAEKRRGVNGQTFLHKVSHWLTLFAYARVGIIIDH